jgi:hypothetical protein
MAVSKRDLPCLSIVAMDKLLSYGEFTAESRETALLHVHAGEARHQLMKQGNWQDQQDMHEIA